MMRFNSIHVLFQVKKIHKSYLVHVCGSLIVFVLLIPFVRFQFYSSMEPGPYMEAKVSRLTRSYYISMLVLSLLSWVTYKICSIITPMIRFTRSVLSSDGYMNYSTSSGRPFIYLYVFLNGSSPMSLLFKMGLSYTGTSRFQGVEKLSAVLRA